MSTRLTILRRGDGAYSRCDCCGEAARQVEATVRILCSGCGRYLCDNCSRQCRHAAQDHRHVGPWQAVQRAAWAAILMRWPPRRRLG
jgi:hypothetical protein